MPRPIVLLLITLGRPEMKITIEYGPTHTNMDYAEWLEIDIIQRLSQLDFLHLIDDRAPELVTRDEDIFEIKADNELIFSKQALGRLPNGEEVVNYVVNNSLQ